MTEMETQNWREKQAAAYVLFLCHPLTFQFLSASLQQYIVILNKLHSWQEKAPWGS